MLMAILGLLLAASTWLATQGRAAPIATVDDVEPLVLSVGPNGRDLRFHGDFTEGAADRVRDLLRANPRIERVHLTSDGGLVDEARAIGAMIAAHGLATYVPDTCVSACTLAFVSGRERFMVREAKLGFHAPFETGDDGREVPVDSTDERRDYVAAGVAAEFVDAALGTPSAQIWFPDADRLRAAGVVTAVVDTARFPDSTLDGGATFALARGTALRNVPLLAVFEAHAPVVVDEAAAWYLAGYRAGRSEADALAGLRAMTARAARDALAEADLATVAGFGRLTAEALASTSDAQRCGEIGLAADAVAVDDARRPQGAPRPSERLAALVERAIAARPTRDLGAGLTEATTVPEPEPVACSVLRTRYAGALANPSDASLRTFLFGSRASMPRLEATAR